MGFVWPWKKRKKKDMKVGNNVSESPQTEAMPEQQEDSTEDNKQENMGNAQ